MTTDRLQNFQNFVWMDLVQWGAGEHQQVGLNLWAERRFDLAQLSIQSSGKRLHIHGEGEGERM